MHSSATKGNMCILLSKQALVTQTIQFLFILKSFELREEKYLPGNGCFFPGREV